MSHFYSSQIIQSYPEPPSPTRDVWEFHDLEENYRRQLTDPSSLELYALSPSTLEMKFIGGSVDGNGQITSLPEFKVYGPRGALVWFEIPPLIPSDKRHQLYLGRLQKLYLTLHEQGKVKV